MLGTSALNGKPLSGLEHLKQSLEKLLTTPLGSRVMRRTFGSNLFSLIDAPLNRLTIVQLYAATIEAVLRWEPRISPTQVAVTASQPGRVVLSLSGIYTPTGKPVTLDGIVVNS